jgi:hypothetical protein
MIGVSMNRKNLIPNIACFALIALAGIATRFWNYENVPFTNDELSALFRTHFDNFADLLKGGVFTDAHPPLIQVFIYYWTSWFGEAEWIVKLPFTLFGLGAILFAYLIGKQWFNHTVGLIVAAFLSTMEYTVMYSQIARPYISGLFFALAMVYFWTRLIRESGKKNLVASIFYILFAGFCCYNHHFSLLFAAIVGVSGLFFLRKKALVKYLIINAVIVILYLPNLPVFFTQLKIGGVEEWLGKPHNEWLLTYMQYLFHFSMAVGIVAVALTLMGWFRPRKETVKWLVLAAVWFFLPFLIGFFYSRYVNAVLQYSALIFSFLFLLLLLFGQIKKQSGAVNLGIVIIILAVNTFTLIHNRQYYKLFYASNFEKVLLDNRTAQQKYKPVCSLVSWNPYMTYHLNKFSMNENFTRLDTFSDPKILISFLEKHAQTADYLYVGAFSSSPPELFPIIQDYYPYICELQYYPATTTAVLAKNNAQRNNVLNYDTLLFSDLQTHELDSAQAYSSAVVLPFRKIITHEKNFIDISLEVYGNGQDSTILVAELSSKGQNIYWTGVPFCRYGTKKGEWLKVYLSLKLSDIYLNYKDIELKIFVWNLHGEKVKTRNLSIKRREGNPVVYGLFDKIPKHFVSLHPKF